MPLSAADLYARVTTPMAVVAKGKDRIIVTSRAVIRPVLGMLVKQSWTNAATLDADGYSASHVGAGSAGTTSMTLGGALCTAGVGLPDVPRNVVITVTHDTSVVAMSGTITGTNYYGKPITEAWSVSATGTSKTFNGKKAFKTITSITEVIVADASTNTVIAGSGDVLGLAFIAAMPNIIGETEDGAIPTAGTLVAGSTASTADGRGTYDPNSALNGAKDFSIYYLVEDFEGTDDSTRS